MMSLRRVQILIALGLAAGLAACETPEPVAPPPPPPAPVAIVEPPPPPPPPPRVAPNVALASQIIEQASTFRAYMAVNSGISPQFNNPAEIQQALRKGVAFEHTQLQQGAVAFAAVIALQEPNFVAAVREFAYDDGQRTDIANRIRQSPEYAASFANADKAAGLAIAALDGLGAKVWVNGRAVKQSAYDVQRQAWSKANVANPTERLEGARSLSGQRLLPAMTDVEELRRASVGGAAMSLAGEPVPPPYSPVIIRGLAIAALAALGQAGDENYERTAPLLVEESTAYCLNISKLMVYQCLAVSKPHYEDIFCLGEHSMSDVGQCVVKAAASPNPAFVPPPPPPRVEPVRRTPPTKAATKAAPKAKR